MRASKRYSGELTFFPEAIATSNVPFPKLAKTLFNAAGVSNVAGSAKQSQVVVAQKRRRVVECSRDEKGEKKNRGALGVEDEYLVKC